MCVCVCALLKINTKRTRYLSQERGVRQGCCLSPTLFNIYINELALSLERSAAPGLTLHDSQIRCLLCVCVCVCGHVYVVYEDTNLYNDMGMTGITRRR